MPRQLLQVSDKDILTGKYEQEPRHRQVLDLCRPTAGQLGMRVYVCECICVHICIYRSLLLNTHLNPEIFQTSSGR